MVMCGRLHGGAIGGNDGLRPDELARDLGLPAEHRAERAIGVIAHLILAARAVGPPAVARVGNGNDRPRPDRCAASALLRLPAQAAESAKYRSRRRGSARQCAQALPAPLRRAWLPP